MVWTCVGVSLAFVLLRVHVRLRVLKRLFDDDFLVILTWLILLSCTILWHVRNTLTLMYESFYVGYGKLIPSSYFVNHLTKWLRLIFSELLLAMLGLWCIKFSFLALFHRLGHNVRHQKFAWWTVLALTIAGLATSIGVCYYPCIFATYEYEISKCIVRLG